MPITTYITSVLNKILGDFRKRDPNLWSTFQEATSPRSPERHGSHGSSGCPAPVAGLQLGHGMEAPWSLGGEIWRPRLSPGDHGSGLRIRKSSQRYMALTQVSVVYSHLPRQIGRSMFDTSPESRDWIFLYCGEKNVMNHPVFGWLAQVIPTIDGDFWDSLWHDSFSKWFTIQ